VVDLKRGGVLPVTDLARVGALRAGLTTVPTSARIRKAGAVAGEPEEARNLEEAFDTFLELRLDRQAACVRAGEPVDATVEPATLDPVSRSRLRQSFRVVAHMQERVRADVGGGRIA
jgi:CBS domain-containing protein